MERKRQIECSDKGRNGSPDSSGREDGLPDETNDRTTPGDFLDQTIAVWQPQAECSLTREDAREIVHNVVGFFRVLQEWAEEDRRSTGLAQSSPQQVGGTE